MTPRAARIAGIGTAMARAMGAWHPHGTGATPMVMPAAVVAYTPVQSYPWGQSGTASYQELSGMWAADGAYIAAAPPAAIGNVRAAGRP